MAGLCGGMGQPAFDQLCLPLRHWSFPRLTLIKVEGTFGDEELAMTMKSREGWILIMPSMEQLNPNNTQSGEMLKWVIGKFGVQPKLTTL